MAGFARRPDTLGTRVDSTRVAGAESATVWIVVISDFHCERCQAVALEMVPILRREFIETGVARMAFVTFPQDSRFNSRFAAHAALCAGSSGRFWEMHDSLFATLPTWDRMNDPRPYFDSLAVRAGARPEDQRSCTERQRLLPLISDDIERSQAAGAVVVPTVIVGDHRLAGDSLTLDAVRGAVKAARKR